MGELYMDLRTVAAPERQIVGVAAPYDETTYLVADLGGERLRPGCFAKSIGDQLAARPARRVPLLVGHKHDRAAIGLATSWAEDAGGLVGTFTIKAGELGDEVLRDAAGGYLGALSVGFEPTKRTRARDGVAEVTEAKLHEVSLVPVGAYAGAGVLAVRAPELDAARYLEPFQNRPSVDLTPIRPVWLR